MSTFVHLRQHAGSKKHRNWQQPATVVNIYVDSVHLVTGDVITVKMMSNETCATPDSAVSAGITVNVNTSVRHVAGNKLKVYPNSTNGLLYITGSTETMEVSIVNRQGR